jgi:hypothetical protein
LDVESAGSESTGCGGWWVLECWSAGRVLNEAPGTRYEVSVKQDECNEAATRHAP